MSMTQVSTKEASGNRWGSNKRLIQQDDGRKAILDAAVRCFGKNDVNATTIDEIAKAASITRRTVYHYFKSKNDILEAAVEQHACDAIDQMMVDLPGDQSFADLIVASTVYLIETMPSEPFYRVQGRGQVGLQASYLYFNLPAVQKKWIKAFQPAYIEALRERTVNPGLHLEDILMWTGRLVLSYIQYPAPNPSKKGIKMEVKNFFGNALTDNINK